MGFGLYYGVVGRKGSELDFYGVREYHPGDDLRRIHWKSTARRGELVVKEMEEERGGDVTLALILPPDSSPDLRERTIRVAVGVAKAASEWGLSTYFLRPGGGIRRFGPGNWRALQRLLAEVEPSLVDPRSFLRASGTGVPADTLLLIVCPLPCPGIESLPPDRVVVLGVSEGMPARLIPALYALAEPAGKEPFSISWRVVRR